MILNKATYENRCPPNVLAQWYFICLTLMAREALGSIGKIIKQRTEGRLLKPVLFKVGTCASIRIVWWYENQDKD